MKTLIFITLILVSLKASSQEIIKGIVLDSGNNPLAYVNVSIEGTVDGTSTEEDGTFELELSKRSNQTIRFSLLGYQEQKVELTDTNFLTVYMKQNSQQLQEITITTSGFRLKGGSSIDQKNAVELVTVGGSEGDLFKSLQSLPGVQISGTDGKLLVRGGDSNESQTYIDGMHVLSAYTTAPANVSARSRYSPFLFEGMSFEQGGYSSEYSQSLSSILPLLTKDKSEDDKIGVQLLTVGIGTGGTKAWNKASTSFNFDYTNLGPYNDVFYPNERNNRWTKPYRSFAGQNQIRFILGQNTILKTYAAYSKTKFNMIEETTFTNNKRQLNLNEDNLYANSTFKTKSESGINFFSGIAFSYNNQHIIGGRIANDIVNMKQSEWHIKSKASKRFTNLYRLEVGGELFVNRYDFGYQDSLSINKEINHFISGSYLSNDFILTSNLYLNVSSRIEYTSINQSWNVLPRAAINYQSQNLTLMAAYGSYQQLGDKDYLLFSNRLDAQQCRQLVTGAYYRRSTQLFRIELYHKIYKHLIQGQEYEYLSRGKGFSNGIDVFLTDRQFLQRWEYTFSYSYNNSKRQYSVYDEMVMPTYATKHNAALALKYNLLEYKTLLGITNRFASGRSYHDPNKKGLMNAETKPYYSLDVCATFLIHPRFIIYASASNIMNRTNVYGYQYSSQKDMQGQYQRVAKVPYQNQFFLVGFFLTIGGKDAYNPSNF